MDHLKAIQNGCRSKCGGKGIHHSYRSDRHNRKIVHGRWQCFLNSIEIKFNKNMVALKLSYVHVFKVHTEIGSY